jgi:FlaA1/EpsC-like NDP-sugar epimerase
VLKGRLILIGGAGSIGSTLAEHCLDVELYIPNVSKTCELLSFKVEVDLDKRILLTSDYLQRCLGVTFT